MSRGSGIHDKLSEHFARCGQCRCVDPENVRVRQPAAIRRTVPDAVLSGMCAPGRSIYSSWLRWLAEDDD